MAGRVQLETSGPQDRFFTLDPEYTYFLKSFKKHSNFSLEYTDLDPENEADFGKTVNFKIPQNQGDLLKTVSVKVTLPEIGTSSMGYIDSVGHALIETAELLIGGVVVQRLTSDYLQIYSEHCVTQTKQKSLEELIGKYSERSASTRVSDREILCHLGASQSDVDYFIDLPFYFYNNPELAIPLCAIKKQEVEVRLKFRDYQDLIVKVDGTYVDISPEVLNLKKCVLCNEVVFLDPCERVKIASTKKDYIITQLQEAVFDVGQGVTSGTFKLQFVNPVKEMYFIIQRQGRVGTGEGQFVTPFDYDNTLLTSNGRLVLYENLDYLTLDLDGQPIITEDTGNVIFLKAVQGCIHHSKTQLLRRFYSYSFACEPENWYPTGQVNFSLVKEQILKMNLTPCVDYERQIRIYALSYNILRVSEGTARTIFNDN